MLQNSESVLAQDTIYDIWDTNDTIVRRKDCIQKCSVKDVGGKFCGFDV